MDHHGGNFMAIAILAALLHRARTGEGQWVDMACTEAGVTLPGRPLLDATVNGRPLRRPGQPNSNRSLAGRWPPTGSTRARVRTHGSPSPAATTRTGRRLGGRDR